MRTLLNLCADPAEDVPVVRHRDDLTTSYIEVGHRAGWMRDDGTPSLDQEISIAVDGSRQARAAFFEELAEQATTECLRLRSLTTDGQS